MTCFRSMPGPSLKALSVPEGRAEDVRWLRRALALAARGLGETNPNPLVGCVVVKGGRVVGEGFHERAGGPHAEIVALEKAGERARGATLYVNLEPCAHLGRTGPCAPRIAAAGVRRVVAAIPDPDPRVDGRGLALLRRSGVSVASGVLRDEALLLNERFLVAATKARPYVLLKAALSLDGRIATRRGDSKWITSPAQRREARRMRRFYDGVMVGIGTVLADDPLLLPEPRVSRPFHRIVLDTRLRIPLGSRLVRSSRRQPVWVLTAHVGGSKRRRLEAMGVNVVSCPTARGRIALAPALEGLRARGLWSVMVEGGSEVLGSFLHERLFDQVALFRAPLLLGGRGSLPAFGGPDPRRLADAQRLSPFSPLLGAGRIPAPSRDGDPAFELWYPVD